MIRILYLIFVGIIAMWMLSSGIHWASAGLISLFCIIGAIIVSLVQTPLLSRFAAISKNAYGGKISIAPFRGFGPLAWMLVLMIVFALVSIIPVPLDDVALISPKTAEFYTENADIVTTGSGSLSVAPGRTAYALVMLFGFLGLFVFTSAISCERRNMIRLMRILTIAAAGLVALFALRYAGFGISFGASGPQAAMHIGLPVNPNHTAAVMSLVSLLALGMSFSQRHHDSAARRGLWLLIYAAFGITVIMLKSRGAILGWGLGHIVLFASLWLSRRRIQLKFCMIALGCLFAVIAAATYLSSGVINSIKNEMEETPIVFDASDLPDDNTDEQPAVFTKTQMYGDFVRMSKDWRYAGTGRSAFADIYPQYQSFPFAKRFRHAENEYMEIVLEYGWFCGALLLLLGFIGFLLFFKTFLNTSDERTGLYGLMAGVIAILIQNCFDFGLRYWTVGVPFWVACGILEGRRKRWLYGKQKLTDLKLNKRRIAQLCAVTAILAAGLVFIFAERRLWRDGITESGIQQLSQAIQQQENEQAIHDILAANLRVRPASVEVRKLMGENAIRHAHAVRSDSESHSLYQNAARWFLSAHRLVPHDPYIMLHCAKLCMALGDESCAVDYLYRVADETPRLRALAMSEVSVLSDNSLTLPQNETTLRVLISALLRHKRIDTAQNLVSQIPNDEAHQILINEFSYQIYAALGFWEGCDMVAQRMKDYPVTPSIFRIRAETYLRNESIPELFRFLTATEPVLGKRADYWQQRLYYSVYYGKTYDADWYRHDIPRYFLEYRNTAHNDANYRFYNALYDAHYAIELGQNNRAQRSAQQALSIRPKHKEAKAILEQAQKGLQTPAALR